MSPLCGIDLLDKLIRPSYGFIDRRKNGKIELLIQVNRIPIGMRNDLGRPRLTLSNTKQVLANRFDILIIQLRVGNYQL